MPKAIIYSPLHKRVLTGKVGAVVLDPFGQSQEGGHVGLELVQKFFLIAERQSIPFDYFVGEQFSISRAGLWKVQQLLVEPRGGDGDIVFLGGIKLSFLDGCGVTVVHDFLREDTGKEQQ